jgi:hypothetical protein
VLELSTFSIFFISLELMSGLILEDLLLDSGVIISCLFLFHQDFNISTSSVFIKTFFQSFFDLNFQDFIYLSTLRTEISKIKEASSLVKLYIFYNK